jgi:hypothetical protein
MLFANVAMLVEEGHTMFLMPRGASGALWSMPRWSLDRLTESRRETSQYGTEGPNYRHTERHQTLERGVEPARRSGRFGSGNEVSRIAILVRDYRQVKLPIDKPVVPLLPGQKAGVSAAAF